MNRFLLFVVLASTLGASTPLYMTFGLENGYDSNVLRLSELEKGEAAHYLDMLGGMETFDSHILKGSIQGKKEYYIRGRVLAFSGSFGLTNYSHSTHKQYNSHRLLVSYKLGSYKKIDYLINHLDQYYLRHYIDRDISSTLLNAAAFTDRNQRIGFSYPLLKRTWLNIWGGYLQRYYNNPFTEFDLDIYYGKIKINRSIRKFGTVVIQFEQVRAVNKTFGETAVASDFDRSYNYYQFYIPISKTKRNRWTDGVGFSTRADIRTYDAENLSDPLHAGRNHLDLKLDVWAKKNITEWITLKSTLRYRSRSTKSQFEWVESLKSFSQWQLACKLEWNMIYDKY